jgi:3-hydroxybutyryl-CoA dehydrogenase
LRIENELKILVVGGGTMGRGIAGLCAIKGHAVAIYEADEAARSRLSSAIHESWSRAVAKGKLEAADVQHAWERVRVVEDLAGGADADVVIEAVPESLEAKRSVFADLDRTCTRASVLGSNTSSLSIAAIASATSRPERVVGIHFFNPVAAMPLVEVVRSPGTSSAAERAALDLVRGLGKTPVRVRDAPGFATSRLGVALGLEAMRMVEEGVASAEDIDRAMELGYGHRMGPLKTSDLVGLDVRLSIARSLAGELSEERFRPPGILERLVRRGRLGKKSGRGFYAWEEDTPRAIAPEEDERG